jgi:Domain of Unknown Function with PDB structure (DUF3857)
MHLKQIPIRSLAVGDKLEFEILLTMQQPEVPGEFWGAESFGAGIVYLERSIELHVPKQRAVTVDSPEHPPVIAEAGGERVYRWTGAQLRPTSAKADEGEPQDTKPPIAWTSFPSWEAVGVWYRNLNGGDLRVRADSSCEREHQVSATGPEWCRDRAAPLVWVTIFRVDLFATRTGM